jgi:hypothetical protein
MVAEWLTRFTDAGAFRSEIVGRSGNGIHDYLKPGSFVPEYGFEPGQTFLEKLAAGRYEFVVLQAVNRFIVGATGEEHYWALGIFCRAIRDAGGEPVINESGWAPGAAEDEGRARILQLAHEEKVKLFVPCSTSWKRVRAERPDLELHNLPDRVHPGSYGNYLNACCFVAAFAPGAGLSKLPREYDAWYPMKPAEAAEKGGPLVDASPRDDYYYRALPRFLKTRTLLAQPFHLDPGVASYLQKVAAETVAEFRAKL